jgi:hypothetical protein
MPMRTFILSLVAVAICISSPAADRSPAEKREAPEPEPIEVAAAKITDCVIDYQVGTLAFLANGVWFAWRPPEASAADAAVATSTLLSDIMRAKRVRLTYTVGRAFISADWNDEDGNYSKVAQLRLFF